MSKSQPLGGASRFKEEMIAYNRALSAKKAIEAKLLAAIFNGVPPSDEIVAKYRAAVIKFIETQTQMVGIKDLMSRCATKDEWNPEEVLDRIKMGFKRKQLSMRLASEATGIDMPEIYEFRRTIPSNNYIHELCNLLEVRPEWILRGEEPMESDRIYPTIYVEFSTLINHAGNIVPGIGPRFKEARESRGYTIEDLSKLTGSPPDIIEAMEQDKLRLHLVQEARMSYFLRVNHHWVLTGEGDMNHRNRREPEISGRLGDRGERSHDHQDA